MSSQAPNSLMIGRQEFDWLGHRAPLATVSIHYRRRRAECLGRWPAPRSAILDEWNRQPRYLMR